MSRFCLGRDLKFYDVTVSKTINLNTAERPCYDGDDYNKQEYIRLVALMREQLGCVSPFIPRQLRDGLQVCGDNKLGRRAADILRTRVGWRNPNMWKSDYYFMPPCTFYEFTMYELSRSESSSK